jgi:MFS family permease
VPLRARFRLSIHAFRISGANGSLRLVQLARLASVTGRWAYTVTLAVFAYRSAGAGGVALAALVRLGPAAAAAPFAGALIRRFRLDRLLLCSGVLRTIALAGVGAVVLLDGPSWAVYALAGVESALSTVIRPAQNSLLPTLSRTPEELTSNNLALSVIESCGVFLGPLIGAALLHGTSIGIVFIAAASAYLVSALLLIPIRTPRQEPRADTASRKGFITEALAGARAVAGDKATRIVVVLCGAQNFVAGALNVLIVVTALQLLGLGQSGVGALTAAVGVGGVVGGALVFVRLRRGRHGADLALGLLLWGIPLVLLSLLSSQAAAFFLLAVVGIGVTVVDVASVTLLQRTARGDLLPHALGVLQTVFVASVAAGTLVAPVLVSALGIRGALLCTGAVLPVLSIALWSRLRRLDERPAANPALVALLAAIPIFAPLPEAVLEHLAASLEPLELAAGTTVFSEGDHGDGFYVIERGEVEVLIAGRRVRNLGAGDSFGEIALLRDVPRTATIATTSSVLLQRLDRARFIGTVAGDPASSNAADAVVGARLGMRTPWDLGAGSPGLAS